MITAVLVFGALMAYFWFVSVYLEGPVRPPTEKPTRPAPTSVSPTDVTV
jgi:hypothetical protein